MRQIPITVILFFSSTVSAQNIVPNASFEDINICTEVHQPCSPSAWFYVNNFVPKYSLSNIEPVSGNMQLNLEVVNTERPERHYWQTMLLCPLEAGKKYKVSLKLAAEYIGPNLNDIGLWFTDSLLFIPRDTVLQPQQYIGFLDARFKKLKKGWIEIQKEFTATASKHFLIVGNFSGKTNKQIEEERKLTVKRLILAVDDLTIIPADGIYCIGTEKLKDSLYAIHERHSRPGFRDIPVITSIVQPMIPMKENVDTIVINNIEFDFDSYRISNPDTLQYLRKYLLDTTVKKIMVVGFTDNTGTEQYNKDLSEKRAKAVALFFINSFGLNPGNIQAAGKGISIKYAEPRRNRRVEIYIHH